MRDLAIDQVAALLSRQLPSGVFLCVGGETPNVMTVGWGGLAYYWRRDVFVAPVRQQRFTYPLLEKEGVFTISIPFEGTMQEALAKAGTLSGRDGDKFATIGLKTRKAQQLDAPVVPGCAYYLECRVRARTAFTQAETDGDIIAGTYQQGDFHTLFYGEIVACYAGERAE